jgi:Domain of unknown function (DUF1902)
MIAGDSPLSTQTTLAVNVSHDKQESVWYVLSSDIPGLHAEAETLDELVTVISDVAPDLILANLPGTPGDTAISIQHMVNLKSAQAA